MMGNDKYRFFADYVSGSFIVIIEVKQEQAFYSWLRLIIEVKSG